MKLIKLVTAVAIAILLLTISCAGPAETPGLPTPTPTLPAQGEAIVVISTADSGSGTLRQALLDAQRGDTITFDPAVFSPNAPATIYLTSGLPPINQGNLTIDASNAGVILDGGNTQGEWVVGLAIHSDSNAIQGLQIVNFSGAGIQLIGQGNTIGGDRSKGNGPIGQGNLLSGNADGIGIEGVSAVHNQISGNLIGTDVTGKSAWGNQNPGIFIQDGARYNTIGSANIIAYNQFGIEIRDPDCIGNTITQNSIHHNDAAGVCLRKGSNGGISTPCIFDFDLDAGRAGGVACPNCIVEIFSDEGNQGKIYEGQTTADDAGAFSFNKGESLAGPCLTATATDANGNTSGLSSPTSGVSRILTLQKGNDLPKLRFQTKESRELEDNRIGSLWDLKPWDCYEGDAKAFVHGISELGLKRVRLCLNHGDWPDVDWDKGEYSKFQVCYNHEETVTGLADNGIKLMGCLVFWDPESPGQVEEEGYSRFKTEDEIQRYLDYVQFIVHHFKDRIEYYEILNEPNIWEGTQQHVELEDYINLVRRVVPVIRQEQPGAKLVVGATAAFREENTKDYLFGILQSDIMPLVDGVSFHPMYGTSPQYDTEEKVFEASKQYYYKYPLLIQEMKDTASTHGFKGEFIADELTWRTEETYFEGEPWTYSEIVAAKYYAKGTLINLGLDLTVGLGVEPEVDVPTTTVVRNLCTVMAGAAPINLPMEIQSEATNIRSCGFSLSNGDKLIALWTDGIAVDDDPGVKATLSISGISTQKAVGIDVLNGFEQELVTSIRDGDLVIPHLLVKDYPIILRLTP